jgi:hypothetical protein
MAFLTIAPAFVDPASLTYAVYGSGGHAAPKRSILLKDSGSSGPQTFRERSANRNPPIDCHCSAIRHATPSLEIVALLTL